VSFPGIGCTVILIPGLCADEHSSLHDPELFNNEELPGSGPRDVLNSETGVGAVYSSPHQQQRSDGREQKGHFAQHTQNIGDIWEVTLVASNLSPFLSREAE